MNRVRELPRKLKTHHQIFIIVVATFIVYFNVLFNGFVLDDSFQVIDNRWITNIRYIPEIFSSPFVQGGKYAYYRPLIHVFYMITYYLFGLKPWGYHLVSVLFHAANSALVFLITAHLLARSRESGVALPLSAETGNERAQWIPFAAALLFVTHPIHTESVAWVSVTDLFLSFFYLLSFYLYIRSSEEGPLQRVAYAFSIVSFFLAALCKEPGLTLPAVLIAYDYAFRKAGARFSYYFKRYVPFLAAAGIYITLRLRVLSGLVPFRTPLEMSPSQDIIDIVVLFRKYIEKLLLPVNLNVWHVFRPPDSFVSLTWTVSVLAAICFLAIAVIAIRKSRVSFVGFMFIVAPLLPAFYLPAIAQGLVNAFTERYVYLPSVGFVLLAGLVLARLKKQRPEWNAGLMITALAIVVVYSAATIHRIPAWKDNYTIWSDAARKSPESAVPHNGLAAALKEMGKLDDAIKEYLVAESLDAKNPFTHGSLGLAYVDKGWTDKAMKEFQTALTLYPGYAEAHDFLGVLYGSLGQNDKAVAEFQAALDLKPDLDYAYKHLGIAYNNLGLNDKAIESFQAALRLNPEDADVYNNLGVLSAERGMMDRAVEQFEAAIKLKPDDPMLHDNAAKAYRALGRADAAERHMREAERLEKSGEQ